MSQKSTVREWQEKYGFSDEDMGRIRAVCITFKGKVLKIKEAKDGNKRWDW